MPNNWMVLQADQANPRKARPLEDQTIPIRLLRALWPAEPWLSPKRSHLVRMDEGEEGATAVPGSTYKCRQLKAH